MPKNKSIFAVNTSISRGEIKFNIPPPTQFHLWWCQACGHGSLVSKFTNKDFLSRVLKRKSKFSLPMTILLNHSDCDGSWNVDECVHLKMELQEIKQIFINEPPDLSIIELKQDIFKFYGVKPENLFECFIDSDCEFLIDRLIQLCDLAIQENRPIIFQ